MKENDQALPAADASPRPCGPKVTREQAVTLLVKKLGYVVICLPIPQKWPWDGDYAIGCCLDNYMGARIKGKLFEVTRRTDWAELDATAKFLGVGNPIPKSRNAGYFRAVMIERFQCEEVEVVRRKS